MVLVPPAKRVRGHRQRDDDANHDLLNEGRNAAQVQSVSQNADNQDAYDGSTDSADAAVQACAADDYRGNRIELITGSCARLGRIQAASRGRPTPIPPRAPIRA